MSQHLPDLLKLKSKSQASKFLWVNFQIFSIVPALVEN